MDLIKTPQSPFKHSELVEDFNVTNYNTSEDPCQTLPLTVETVEARKLERHYPHALKVKYRGS